MLTKPFIFVLMPFDSSFEDIYKLGIKATCEDLNTYCERVDEQIFDENILDRIYNQISKADIIVADLTGKNPNVFYETGYAHALGKKVVLLTQKSDDIPFDLKHYPHIIYDGKIVKLKQELEKRIDWFIKHPNQTELPNELSISLLINGVKLEQEHRIQINQVDDYYHRIIHHAKSAFKLKIDINNTGNTVFDSHVKIGIIISDGFDRNIGGETKVIKLNQNEYLHLSPEYSRIYPQSWEEFSFILLSDIEQDLTKKNLSLVIRIFTAFGIKDFPINLIHEEKTFSF